MIRHSFIHAFLANGVHQLSVLCPWRKKLLLLLGYKADHKLLDRLVLLEKTGWCSETTNYVTLSQYEFNLFICKRNNVWFLLSTITQSSFKQNEVFWNEIETFPWIWREIILKYYFCVQRCGSSIYKQLSWHRNVTLWIIVYSFIFPPIALKIADIIPLCNKNIFTPWMIH